MNFDFSIMKKLWDLAHEKLIDIIGRHGILDQYSWMSATPWNSHLCSKTAQKPKLPLGTVYTKYVDEVINAAHFLEEILEPVISSNTHFHCLRKVL